MNNVIIENHELRIGKLENNILELTETLGDIKGQVKYIYGRFKEADNRKLEKAIINGGKSLSDKIKGSKKDIGIIGIGVIIIEIIQQVI